MSENVFVLVLNNFQGEAFVKNRYPPVYFYFCAFFRVSLPFNFNKKRQIDLVLKFDSLCIAFKIVFILILLCNAFPILVGWFPQSCVKSHWQRITHMTFVYCLRFPLRILDALTFGLVMQQMSNQSLGLFCFS